MASEPGLKLSPVGVLAQLFVDLFTSAAKISAFARSYQGVKAVTKDLPGDNVPVAEMAVALATSLHEHGLVDQALFIRLAHLRPLQREKLRQAAQSCGVVLGADDQISPLSSRKKAWAAGSIATASAGIFAGVLWWHQAPAATDRKDTDSVIILDPNGLDPVVLTVVSHRQGKSWRVLLSKHRTGESAARAIFIATFLQGNQVAAIALEQDQFSLCQDGKCVSKEVIGDTFQAAVPVALDEDRGEVVSVPSVVTPVYIKRALTGENAASPPPPHHVSEKATKLARTKIRTCPAPTQEWTDIIFSLDDKAAIATNVYRYSNSEPTERCAAKRLKGVSFANEFRRNKCKHCLMQINAACFGPDADPRKCYILVTRAT